jgi:hypothetical protein
MGFPQARAPLGKPGAPRPLTRGIGAVAQRAQDARNFKFAKPVMQAQQDQRNAPFFAAYAAAHPGQVQAGAPGVPPAAAAPAPAAPAPAPPPDPNAVDPRDSTYGVGLTGLLGQVQTQRQRVATDGARDQQGYDENVKTLAAQRADALVQTKEGSNKQGLLYSGILGKRNGEVNGQYDAQGQANLTALNGRNADRQAQLQDIGELVADPNSPYGYSATGNAGLSFYNLLSGAADRRIAAMPGDPLVPTTTPDAGPAPAVQLPAGSGNPTAQPKAAPRPKARIKAGSVGMTPFKRTGAVAGKRTTARPFARTGSQTNGL